MSFVYTYLAFSFTFVSQELLSSSALIELVRLPEGHPACHSNHPKVVLGVLWDHRLPQVYLGNSHKCLKIRS